jgi:hypothetical protein
MNAARGFGAIAVVLTTYAAACAKDLSQLEPFPCAKDGTCPDGMACVPGTGCITPRIDSPCTADTDCKKASVDATCILGACVTICDRVPCPEGRTCVRTTVPAERPNDSPVAGAACMLPCDTGSCPAGLVCVQLGTGQNVCTNGTIPDYVPIGAPCVDGKCPGHDGSVACSGGTCVKRGCPCEPGMICTRREGGSLGVCLPDCTGGEACPSGSVCKTLWYADKKACMAPGSEAPACIGTEDTQPCTTFACGASGRRPTSCSGNCNTLPDGTCPKNADKSAFFGCGVEDPPQCYCTCNDGFTGVDCNDGTSCNSNNCQGRVWGCKPTAPPSCNADTDGYSGTCVCNDGKRIPFSCGGGTTCEKICQTPP